jgi:predicted dehydrogenase
VIAAVAEGSAWTGTPAVLVRPLQIGLIGCGRLAEIAYLPALNELEQFRLAAVADPDPDRARMISLRSAGTPPSFADGERMLGAVALDAVVVCSPVDTHLETARAVAAAGLPALVEKPPARDGSSAAELAALDPAPWVGFNRRFTHGRRLLAAVPDDHGPLELEIEIAYRRRSWRSLGDLGDALLDLGPHAVDLSMLLCGHDGSDVEAVAAEVASARARFELVCSAWRSRVEVVTDRPHRERYSVRDAEGTVIAESREGGLRDAVRGRVRPAEHPLLRSIREQLAAFAAAVRGEQVPLLAGADDGERVMRTLDRVRAAGAGTT